MVDVRSCVVVGAGLTAAKVVETLREHGFDGSITVIGNEGERPYERPPLSKDFLQGAAELDTVYPLDEDWYATHDVELRLDDPVVTIERGERQVRLASGASVAYEQLVLATGARPRTLDLPGADLAGVHSLRTIADSQAIKTALAARSRVAVIGAGWIGLEVAAAARAAGCDVTVLEYAALPLQRVLGDRLAGYFADLHRRNGVDLRTGVSVAAIEGADGRARGVRVGEEVVAAELVVVGVGVQPNVELAVDAGLEVDNGVLVDESLRTSDPSILAAGDVANAFNTTLGHRLRVEHWDNAIRQGQLAAKTVLGQAERYDWQPYFFTDQFDLGMEYVGHADSSDEVVIRGEMASGEFLAFWLAGGVVRAGMNVNIWDVNDDLRALIGRTIDPTALADERRPLNEL